MGLYIRLEKDSGALIDGIADEKNVLHRLLPREDNSLLSGIDWYGDTIFNRIQIKQFLSEWQNLQPSAASPDERLLLDRIRGLALRCEAEVHSYLRFVGD